MPSVSKVLGDLASSTGSISVAAGSNTAPAITTSGDTNTGIFFPAADTIAFTEGGAESMRIDSSGNVGIGTTSPFSATGYKSLTINGSTTGILAIQANGSNSCYFYSDGGAFNIKGVQNIPMDFYTNDTQRMRIDTSGNVLVGTTSTTPRDFTSGGGTKLPAANGPIEHATGDSNAVFINYTATASGSAAFITFRQQGSNRGTISTNGSTTAYNTTSDYRLKENIAPITGALYTIAQLKPSTYTWKATGQVSQGFIAHELAEVVPDAVTGEKDAVNEDGSINPQGVDTSFLVATLTAAIQEQQAIINELKTRIETLEAN